MIKNFILNYPGGEKYEQPSGHDVAEAVTRDAVIKGFVEMPYYLPLFDSETPATLYIEIPEDFTAEATVDGNQVVISFTGV